MFVYGFDISYGVSPGLIKLDFIQLAAIKTEGTFTEAGSRSHILFSVTRSRRTVRCLESGIAEAPGNDSFHGHVRGFVTDLLEIIRVDGTRWIVHSADSTLRKMLIAAVAFPSVS
ncbi:hypothetical protein AVEN_132269-1 [Araneus ventricosus]|uniref:Uncharacterized protein n=1 Tax=Araneus ventricosus TaxID=182803 RepID=A0A4Y2Q1Q9_ARAVE|nr:hypothetical protein AVEN_132269-1 [Araneus ventricosus]